MDVISSSASWLNRSLAHSFPSTGPLGKNIGMLSVKAVLFDIATAALVAGVAMALFGAVTNPSLFCVGLALSGTGLFGRKVVERSLGTISNRVDGAPLRCLAAFLAQTSNFMDCCLGVHCFTDMQLPVFALGGVTLFYGLPRGTSFS